MVMVVRGKCGYRALIHPAMTFNVAIRKSNDTTAVVRTVWKIEKGFLRHINTEIRPANTVGVHIHKSEGTRGHHCRQITMLFEHFKYSGEPFVPAPCTHVSV